MGLQELWDRAKADQVRGEGADRQSVPGDVSVLQDIQQGGLLEYDQGAQCHVQY